MGSDMFVIFFVQKMVESVPEGVELMPNRKVELETPGLVRKRERETQHDDSQV